MDTPYPLRYAGTRWQIHYGSYSGIEEHAVTELQKALQTYLPYVIQVLPLDNQKLPSDAYPVIIGVVDQNPLLTRLLEQCKLPIPQKPEGYTLACTSFPTHPNQRCLILAGSDPQGVLHAVYELAKKLASQISVQGVAKPVDIHTRRIALDTLPDFQISDYPRIHQRGLWTWGYVIHDYRRYLDLMARLKMNLLIAWNDTPPLNYARIREYAHQRGIKFILGFHWGWGHEGLRVTNPEHRALIKADVLENYRQHYQDLELDGIYFQTLTEHNQLDQDGISTASGACTLVNEISSALFELDPNLKIYFGLHATSILNRFSDLDSLDKRVAIMWEDAGGFPYTYNPVYDPTRPISETINYTQQLATSRPDVEFAYLPKGWFALRWDTEFEHHGEFILGEQAPMFNQQRSEERKQRWSWVNALWARNYPLASRLYRQVLQATQSPITIVGLVEDSYIEEGIQPSVALFAESLWDPTRNDEEILEHALNPAYYQ